MNDRQFIEIERKWRITPEQFIRFSEELQFMPRLVHYVYVEGVDAFFQGREGYIYRYRHDAKRAELTVKSVSEDTEKRVEINLAMEPNDVLAVVKFMSTLGLTFTGNISKDCFVFKFPTAEISLYKASTAAKDDYFLEIEAYNKDEQEALNTISDFEVAIGLATEDRLKENLFDLMIGVS